MWWEGRRRWNGRQRRCWYDGPAGANSVGGEGVVPVCDLYVMGVCEDSFVAFPPKIPSLIIIIIIIIDIVLLPLPTTVIVLVVITHTITT